MYSLRRSPVGVVGREKLMYKRILRACTLNQSWLWLLPDTLIEDTLLRASDEWRTRHGLDLPLGTVIDLRYHDILHILCGVGPDMIGEGLVDAYTQGVCQVDFNPLGTYIGEQWEDYEEDMAWCYQRGMRIHPVLRRIVYKHVEPIV